MNEDAAPRPAQRGLACPRCGCRHFFTTHAEPLADGRIRRRKACRHCDRKIVTYESTATTDAASRRDMVRESGDS